MILKKTDKKVNILITTGIFPPDVGGPAKFVPFVANKLSKNNILKIITLSEETNNNDEFDYEIFRIKRNQNRIYRFLRTVSLIIREGRKVNIIFINGLWLEVYIANLFLRKKTIRKIVGDPIWEKFYTQYVVDDNFDQFQQKKYTLKIELMKFLRNFTLRSNSTIVVPSKHLMNFVKSLGFKGNLLQINNGTEITESKKTNNDSFEFLIVSRLVRQKNIDLVLKALSEVKEKYSVHFKLNIVGEGPEYKNIINLIEQLNLKEYVNLVGPKHGEELNHFYKTSNYFLQISTYEGMPHSVLEAMNYELTVIISNFGGNAELLENNKYGYLVDSFEVEEIANTIYQALNDTEKKFIEGKKLIESKFDIRETIKNYSNLITSNE